MEMEENVPGGQDVKHVQEERNGPAGFDNVAFQHTVVLFLLYLAYSVYSLYRTWGTESATRLLLLLAIVLYVGVGSRLLKLLRILSYVFYPLMYICGVDSQDLLVMSRLVGLKFLSNIQIAYREAGVIIANSKELEEYISLTNGTWYYSGDDVILEAWNQTLTALAICAGTLSALAPKRATFIVNNVVVALIAGNIACFMTGCVAGEAGLMFA
nr:hypothetical protein BaRGS_001424 [Batillaria attramentaria]